ncbi:Rft protein-domain-containing protein [Cladochytrium replicatum]|nr:Rft protein-domain-containing protein [Cladochytrium replicatum]
MSTLKTAIAGAGYLVLLQATSRIGTFLLGIVLTRFLNPEVIGQVYTIEFISATILFVSREPFRNALLRSKGQSLKTKEKTDEKAEEKESGTGLRRRKPQSSAPTDESDHRDDNSTTANVDDEINYNQAVVNLSYIPVFIGAILTAFFSLGSLFTSSSDSSSDIDIHRISVGLYLVAAIIELSSEPFYIAAQRRLLFSLRVRVEGIAFIARSVVTVGVVYYGWISSQKHGDFDMRFYGLLAHAIAQLVYADVLLLYYVAYFLRTDGWNRFIGFFPRTLVDKKSKSEYFTTPELWSLSMSFVTQSALKHVLTYGDQLVLIATGASDHDKGIYSFVERLGSLVARVLFQPIEDASRVYFSRELSSDEGSTTSQKKKSAWSLLSHLLKIQSIIALYFLTFGTTYSADLIQLVYSRKWAKGDTPHALATYCLYVPIMGINGITEGFFQAVAPKDKLHSFTRWMLVFWGAFAGVAMIAMNVLHLGAVGLVLANLANMALRVWFCLRFIKGYFGQNLGSADVYVKSVVVWTCFGISWVVALWSGTVLGADSFRPIAIHIAVGGLLFAISSLALYTQEKDYFKQLMRLREGR